MAQRLRWRVGFALRGSFCRPRRAASRSASLRLASPAMALSCTYFFAYLATSFSRLSSRWITATLALLGFFVGPGRGGDADIETTQCIDLVVLDFRKNDLLLDADVVVAAALEGAARDAPKVTHPRQGHGHETVEELIHLHATQRDHATDGLAFADLEAGNGLFGLGHHRFLTRDPGQVGDGAVHHLLVRDGLAHAHVQGDLAQAGNLHGRAVAELPDQFGDELVAVNCLESCHGCLSGPLDFGAAGLEHAHACAVGL